MVASMTGFCRAEKTDERGRVVVEFKSVNHRFLQLDCYLPLGQNWAEPLVRQFCEDKLSRGKVTFRLNVFDYRAAPELHLNHTGVRQVLDLAKQLESETGRPVPCSLDGILALPGMLQTETSSEDQETAWERIRPVVEAALQAFVKARRDEGARLARDLSTRRDTLRASVDAIKTRVPEFKQAFSQRFTTRIHELAGQAGFEESRLATEIALWTDRSDISEELTRLDSHLEQFAQLLKASGPIGRKLDFLLQELNREANTVGSKIGDLAIVQQVLEIKGELEKIREQLQNIE